MRNQEVQPNGENATEEELRVAMEAAPTKRSYIRLAVVRALLLGTPRQLVCELFDRTDRMVRLWIHLFNQAGIDALTTQGRSGRPRKVRLQHLEDLLVPVLEDPSQAGEVHWTGVKVHGWLKETLEIPLGYSTVIRWLHELDFHRRMPRPWPDKQDEAVRQNWLKEAHDLVQDPTVRLWFSDECGVEGDPRPRQRWVKPGSKPTVPYRGTHIRRSVVGAVCPETGEFFSLIFTGVDTDVFQVFLDQLAAQVPDIEGKRQILICDNASWHLAQRLDWHHFHPLFLPPYSPDFNPIETLWLYLKNNWFTDFIARNSDELTQRLCQGLCDLMNDPNRLAKLCAFRK